MKLMQTVSWFMVTFWPPCIFSLIRAFHPTHKRYVLALHVPHIAHNSNNRKFSLATSFENTVEPLDEISRIMAAFMNYYELHGDLEVPLMYVVPKISEDWHEELWGMKLGRAVTDIVVNGAFAEHRIDFEDLGLDYKLLKSQSRRQQQKQQRRRRSTVEVTDSPSSYGGDYQWSEIRLALNIYKSNSGHMSVAGTFVVPEGAGGAANSAWPRGIWGMKLGAIVRNIRMKGYLSEHRDELLEMGFSFERESFRVPWVLVRQAFVAYKAIHGDLLVPYRYTIPAVNNDAVAEVRLLDKNQEDTPDKWKDEKQLWGMRLGSIVQCIRNRNAYSEHHGELVEMGFVFAAQKSQYGFETVAAALLTYKSLYGDMLVASSFVVPETDSWGNQQWGMRLGKIVGNIRNGGAYEEQKGYLKSIGFDFNSQYSSWEELKTALQTYLTIHRDLEIPYEFQIPHNDSSWEPRLWGMRLGYILSNIRHSKTRKRYHTELKELGVSFEKRIQRYDWEIAREAIVRYKKLNDCIRVPKTFVIPCNNSDWSPDLWGVKLGQIVYSIRHLNSYSEHWEQLRSIGFMQSSSSVTYTWQHVSSALRSYAEKKSDLRVPQKFVIPRSSSTNSSSGCGWPDDVGGMRLGEIVYRIRNKGLYSEHRGELEVMGFDYTAQRVMYGWARVKTALLTFKSVYGHLNVPRSFKIARPAASAYINVPIKGGSRNLLATAAATDVVRTTLVGGDGASSHANLPSTTTAATMIADARRSDHVMDITSMLPYTNVYNDNDKKLVRSIGPPQVAELDSVEPRLSSFTSNDLIWPPELWGIRLGEVTHNIRTHGAYAKRHRRELEELGFDYAAADDDDNDDLVVGDLT